MGVWIGGLLVGGGGVSGLGKGRGRGRGGDVQFTVGEGFVWDVVFEYDGCIFERGRH